MPCEDYPCCGHEPGCCPSFDEDGRQVDMKCVCGASVPLHSKASLCGTCLRGPSWDDEPGMDYGPDEDDW